MAICDELEGEKADFQTGKTLKDIWQQLSEDQRKPFMDENFRDKWKYLAHWEKWLRNRYCKDTKPHNVISKLPDRPRTAYRYFYEHQMQLMREERAEGLEPGSKSLWQGRYGRMTCEFKSLRPEHKEKYEKAAEADNKRFQEELKEILKEVVSFEQQDQTARDFIEKVQTVGVEPGKVAARVKNATANASIFAEEANEEEPNGTEEGEGWQNIGS